MLSLGPSSKVSAMARRSRGPRHTEAPNTADERPRTAHAIHPAAAAKPAAAMGIAWSTEAYCRAWDAPACARPVKTAS